MRYWQELDTFIRLCGETGDLGSLQRLLDDITRVLGFDYVALTHHVDLATLPDNAMSLITYPDIWLDQLISRRYYEDDPVHLASTRTATGFRWSEVARLVDLTPRHRAIFDAARREGLGEGFTVPVHVPGEYRGSVSFAAASIDGLHPESFIGAQLVSTYAFEAGRRIVARSRRLSEERKPRLTDRQLDCILLVGRGKTDREIATILGISHATVREHLEKARERYGLVSRTQLVVQALFEGDIGFPALLGGSATRHS